MFLEEEGEVVEVAAKKSKTAEGEQTVIAGVQTEEEQAAEVDMAEEELRQAGTEDTDMIAVEVAAGSEIPLKTAVAREA